MQSTKLEGWNFMIVCVNYGDHAAPVCKVQRKTVSSRFSQPDPPRDPVFTELAPLSLRISCTLHTRINSPFEIQRTCANYGGFRCRCTEAPPGSDSRALIQKHVCVPTCSHFFLSGGNATGHVAAGRSHCSHRSHRFQVRSQAEAFFELLEHFHKYVPEISKRWEQW